MQPLQRFDPPGEQKCNPYSEFAPRGGKKATPTAFCGAGLQNTGGKFSLISLIHIYLRNLSFSTNPNQSIFAIQRHYIKQANATPTALWGPRSLKMQTPTTFWGP